MTRLAAETIELDDDALNVYETFDEMGLTDGLPIIPPTRSRVDAMLAALGDVDFDAAVGSIAPRNETVSIGTCAINAVMAGCKPTYLPVVIAAMRAISTPSWDLQSIQSTTNPKTPFVLLNGPLRHDIDVNCGTGAMGPGARANVTIGRALRLILMNAGGARPGAGDMCTQGFAGKFSLFVGENEEDSPWEPYHVERGYLATDSVVTVVAVNSSVNFHDSSDTIDDVLHTVERSFSNAGALNFLDPHNTSVLALNPVHAQILARGGFDKQRLKEHLFDRVRLPVDALSARRRHLRSVYGQDGSEAPGGGIPLTGDPDNLVVIVLGGMGGGHSSFFPNGINGYATSLVVGT